MTRDQSVHGDLKKKRISIQVPSDNQQEKKRSDEKKYPQSTKNQGKIVQQFEKKGSQRSLASSDKKKDDSIVDGGSDEGSRILRDINEPNVYRNESRSKVHSCRRRFKER